MTRAASLYEIIDRNTQRIRFERIRNYGLAKFFMLHVVGVLLREDTKGNEILQNATDYVRGKNLEILKRAVEKLVQLLILDIDNYISDWSREHGGFFDYKNSFKNGEQVRNMFQSVKTAYKKQLIHHDEDAFARIFEAIAPMVP